MTDLASLRLFLRPTRQWRRLAWGILLGMLGLWWATRDLNLSAMLSTLTGASPAWLMVAVIGVVSVALAKAARWASLYGLSDSQRPFGLLLAVLVAAQAINLIIPIRLGEVIRIGLMKQAGQSSALTLLTIIIEKTLDLMATGALAVVLAALALAPVSLRQPTGNLLLLGVIIVEGLILLWQHRAQVEHRLAWPLTWLPKRWHTRLQAMAHTIVEALGRLTHGPTLARVLGWTILIWVLSLLTILALLAAFELRLPLTAAVILMLAVSTSNIAPSPPALIGVMQGIAVVVLGQYGVDQSTALGFGIVLNAVTIIPLIALGGWGLWVRSASEKVV